MPPAADIFGTKIALKDENNGLLMPTAGCMLSAKFLNFTRCNLVPTTVFHFSSLPRTLSTQIYDCLRHGSQLLNFWEN